MHVLLSTHMQVLCACACMLHGAALLALCRAAQHATDEHVVRACIACLQAHIIRAVTTGLAMMLMHHYRTNEDATCLLPDMHTLSLQVTK
jgi:hypothetical protein